MLQEPISNDVQSLISELYPGSQWVIEPLSGGMTNRNFLVTVSRATGEAERVVVQEQLPDDVAETLGIVRSNQFAVLHEIEDLGLAPRLICYDRRSRLLVAEYIDAVPFDELEDRAGAIARFGTALSTLHHATEGSQLRGRISDPFSGTQWLYDRVAKAVPVEAEKHAWAMEALNRFEKARGPYVEAICHSDLSPGNVLMTDEAAFLIDWEYVGAGDPYYDLGDFAEKFSLTREEKETLISSYLGSVDETALALVELYQFVSMLREALWCVMAGQIGFIDFDYATYAQECWTRVATVVRAETFDANLEKLAEAKSGN